MHNVDIEDLYALPLERFVAERNALARELRAGGHRDEATRVVALRKPSAAAHAVNQLARERPDQLRELFTTGDALSEAQSAVIAGRAGGRDLSEAAERERAAVASLVDAARSLLAAEGLKVSASVLERVGETLHAAALNADARESVDHGRLEHELRHVGLGIDAGGAASDPATRRTRAATDERPAGRHAEARRQAEARQQAKARKQAEAAAADARRAAARTVKALDAAERKRALAAVALERTEEALMAARAAAEAAEKARLAAERQVRKLT